MENKHTGVWTNLKETSENQGGEKYELNKSKKTFTKKKFLTAKY